MKTPQSDPELYASCVRIIARGLEATLASEELVDEAAKSIDAAAFILSLLNVAVRP